MRLLPSPPGQEFRRTGSSAPTLPLAATAGHNAAVSIPWLHMVQDRERLPAERVNAALELARAPVEGLPWADLASTVADPAEPVEVRHAVLAVLVHHGPGALVRSLMTHPDGAVRARVCMLLGERSSRGDDDILTLGLGLRDPEPPVQAAARAALKRLGIQPMAAPPSRGRPGH